MGNAEYYENCWAELLKASRGWQVQYDPNQLLTDVCRTAHDLLSFEVCSAFLLEHSGLTERAHWPDVPAAAIPPDAKFEVAQSVVQTGRSVFMQKSIGGKPATILCAPLTASREILGALYLMTQQQQQKIGEKDQQFFEMLASQAAASLEHALLYQSAITDPLTGLFCHRHFRQEVDQAVRRAVRNEEPVTLLLMDLDHFKALNDTCGHEAGNKCLLQVASILRATFRGTDILARFGGDEFEILMLDTGPEGSLAVAEKVRQKIAEIPLPQKKRVTATIGIASFPTNASAAQPLFLCADAALYEAKEAGRNRIIRSAIKPGESAATDSGSAERAVRLVGSALPDAETPRPAAPKPGAIEMVDGHIVKRRLGVGSRGEVLLVTQPGLDRDVALKRPLTARLSFEQMQSFEKEARVTAGLNHPGIVPIFNIGRDHDNRRYYTMKPLDGPTLAQLIEARRKGDMETLHAYTPGRLLEILQRVSETIAYAHARNVLHLDLTPTNIIVGKFGEVTVIDWATGSHASSSKVTETQSVKLVGSPSFVAPELIRGMRFGSTASDVFALGTLLYLLLTDELPFRRATTGESLDALMNGELTPPDVLKPENGIDAMLSALCVEALAANPQARPSAQAFAERLALSLRGEMDWTTIRFGPGGHPLREDEWRTEKGEWRLEGDHWTSLNSNEALLAWKVPVPGSFRLVVEAWADQPRSELSVIGHRPAAGDATFARSSNFLDGYWFQVGAEFNTVTKFARHDHDVLVKNAAQLEPGRRYRIEMEYQDSEGLVHCALNGKRVFTYRELFPFPGAHIALYSFAQGTHYKPLELKRQNWNVQIPALRAADRHYQYGHFASALDCYREIAAYIPDRVQGAEATLKSGLCLASLGRRDEAYQAFDAVAGTIFEPFALAERAIIEIAFQSEGAPQRALQYFQTLCERFPESQARVRIFDASRQLASVLNSPGNCASNMRALMELNRICTKSFKPPAQSQLSAANRLVSYLTWLGRWDEAFEEFLAFQNTLMSSQLFTHDAHAPLVMLALATGRLEYFPKEITDNGFKGYMYWASGLVLHHAVHWNRFEEWKACHTIRGGQFTKMLLHLAQRDIVAARYAAAEFFGSAGWTDNMYNAPSHGQCCAESGDDEIFEHFLSRYQAATKAPNIVQVFRALRALYAHDLESAAALLTGLRQPAQHANARSRLQLQALLSSLGLLKSPSLPELRPELERFLCGTELDLALMFCGEREPVPGKLWPDPRWQPEWRVLLGVWLEAKGHRRAAHDLVAPCRNPAYGFSHCQVQIEALLKRTASSL